jgi:hypothetical protein
MTKTRHTLKRGRDGRLYGMRNGRRAVCFLEFDRKTISEWLLKPHVECFAEMIVAKAVGHVLLNRGVPIPARIRRRLAEFDQLKAV